MQVILEVWSHRENLYDFWTWLDGWMYGERRHRWRFKCSSTCYHNWLLSKHFKNVGSGCYLHFDFTAIEAAERCIRITTWMLLNMWPDPVCVHFTTHAWLPPTQRGSDWPSPHAHQQEGWERLIEQCQSHLGGDCVDWKTDFSYQVTWPGVAFMFVVWCPTHYRNLLERVSSRLDVCQGSEGGWLISRFGLEVLLFTAVRCMGWDYYLSECHAINFLWCCVTREASLVV